MKYLITGASTFGVDNMGDDAMLSCLTRGIFHSDSQNEIIFLARHPNSNFDKLFNMKSIKNFDHETNCESKGRFFLGFNANDDRVNLNNFRIELETSDILIIGGNCLMEISQNTFLRGVSSYSSLLAQFSLLLNKPYALFGLNIVEPMHNDYVISQAKFLIENAKIVTARENDVLGYLNDVNINTENVIVTSDPAYGLDLNQVAKFDGTKILSTENINLDKNKKTFSICIREEYWKSDKKSIEKL